MPGTCASNTEGRSAKARQVQSNSKCSGDAFFMPLLLFIAFLSFGLVFWGLVFARARVSEILRRGAVDVFFMLCRVVCGMASSTQIALLDGSSKKSKAQGRCVHHADCTANFAIKATARAAARVFIGEWQIINLRSL